MSNLSNVMVLRVIYLRSILGEVLNVVAVKKIEDESRHFFQTVRKLTKVMGEKDYLERLSSEECAMVQSEGWVNYWAKLCAKLKDVDVEASLDGEDGGDEVLSLQEQRDSFAQVNM